MICKRCKEFKEKYPPVRGEDGLMYHHLGDGVMLSEIECAFTGSSPFSKMRFNNFHCQTMDALREHLDYQHRNGDSTIGVIATPLSTGEMHVVMTWYKDRGRVSDAYIITEGIGVEYLTLGVAEDILRVREEWSGE